MNESIKNNLQIIIDIIDEVKFILTNVKYDYFLKKPVIKRALEREVEIIDDAIQAIQKEDNTIQILYPQKSAEVREFINEDNGSLSADVLWIYAQKYLPSLRETITRILNKE